MVQYLQDVTRPKVEEKTEDNREPFEVMVDTLSGIVKNHLNTSGHETITKDYIEKLDTTLSVGVPIDLRSVDEKEYVDAWKKKHIPLEVKTEEKI